MESKSRTRGTSNSDRRKSAAQEEAKYSGRKTGRNSNGVTTDQASDDRIVTTASRPHELDNVLRRDVEEDQMDEDEHDNYISDTEKEA